MPPATVVSAAPAFVEVSTDGVRPSERLSFWRDGVLRRIEPVRFLEPRRPFAAHIRALRGNDVELMQHSSDAVIGIRTSEHVARHGRDDIAIDLMVECGPGTILDQNGQHILTSGDLVIADYGQPLQVIRSRHRSISIMLPRHTASEALGVPVAMLAGRSITTNGIGGLLRSHMRASMDEAPHMTAQQRALAVTIATDLTLAALQAELSVLIDIERFALGFYHAARRVIARDCRDPALTPNIIAAEIGCSRATLYRMFASHGETVAASIWLARLTVASQMLASPRHRLASVADIAFRSGFSEPVSFSRMFKRHFGMTPSDARGSS